MATMNSSGSDQVQRLGPPSNHATYMAEPKYLSHLQKMAVCFARYISRNLDQKSRQDLNWFSEMGC